MRSSAAGRETPAPVIVGDDPRLALLRLYRDCGLLAPGDADAGAAHGVALDWTGEGDDAPPAYEALRVDTLRAEDTTLSAEQRQLLGHLDAIPERRAHAHLARRVWHLDRRYDARMRSVPRDPAVDAGRALFTATFAMQAVRAPVPAAPPSAFRAVQWLQAGSLSRDGGARAPVVFWHGRLRMNSQELWQCSLWRSLPDRTDPRVHALSKALPQRCEIREMSHATRRKAVETPSFGREFDTWVECSLLGLYPHSRGTLSVARLAEYFSLTEVARDVFHGWMERRHDVLGCLLTRDFLIHNVKQQPALMRAIQNTFQWARFVDIVARTGEELRARINLHGWAVLFLGDPDDLVAAAAGGGTKPPARKRARTTR